MHVLKICVSNLFLLVLFILASGELSADSPILIADKADVPQESFSREEYCTSRSCRMCHEKIFEQYSQSMHAKSFSNPLFQAQYFREVLPQVNDENIRMEAQACIACHSPVEYMTGNRLIPPGKAGPEIPGVGCDFCHTVTGHKGKNPGNGNYISQPGFQNTDPFNVKNLIIMSILNFRRKAHFAPSAIMRLTIVVLK